MEFKNHPSYPPRAPVDVVNWYVPCPGYNPVAYTAPSVLAGPSWAHPMELSDGQKELLLETYSDCPRDESSRMLLNPRGRTGMTGRGLLGKYGPNQAVDPIVVRYDKTTGCFDLAVIQRGDTGNWALPGGMIDPGETPLQAAKREFKEEAGLDLDQVDLQGFFPVYSGYVVDPRNTDLAWMETTALYFEVPTLIPELKAGSDAVSVKWVPIVDGKVDGLYANHSEFVERAIALAQLTDSGPCPMGKEENV